MYYIIAIYRIILYIKCKITVIKIIFVIYYKNNNYYSKLYIKYNNIIKI